MESYNTARLRRVNQAIPNALGDSVLYWMRIPRNGTPPWALATLKKHATDRRVHQYSLEEFEAGATHHPLWTAAQRELVVTGTIQNYLPMLWGKKVIEWSNDPESGIVLGLRR